VLKAVKACQGEGVVKTRVSWGTWVAQLFKGLSAFGSGRGPRALGLSPTLGSLLRSLLLPLLVAPPAYTFSLSNK